MKLKDILLLLAIAAGILALTGTEKTDGSPDILWFVGWVAAAALFGWLSTLKIRKRNV